MSKDPFLYILIGILILHVLKIVSLDIVKYAFIGYVFVVFLQSFRKNQEE